MAEQEAARDNKGTLIAVGVVGGIAVLAAVILGRQEAPGPGPEPVPASAANIQATFT